MAASNAAPTSVSESPGPTAAAAMPACTTVSCWVKGTTLSGRVLKNISEKRSSVRCATNFDSRSRAICALGGPPSSCVIRSLGSSLPQLVGSMWSSMLRLRSMSTRISAPRPVRSTEVCGRPGSASARMSVANARIANAVHSIWAIRPALSAGSHATEANGNASRPVGHSGSNASGNSSSNHGRSKAKSGIHRSCCLSTRCSSAHSERTDTPAVCVPAPKKRSLDAAKNSSIRARSGCK